MKTTRDIPGLIVIVCTTVLGGVTPFALADIPTNTRQFAYDAMGNPTSRTDALGHSTVQRYDSLNRPVSLHPPAPQSDAAVPVIRTAYNGRDRVISVTDARQLMTQYVYDGLDNLTSLISPDTGTTMFSHDGGGNILSRQDARGITTSYTYDALNRVTQRVAGNATIGYEYDGGSTAVAGEIDQLTRVSYPAGETRYRYDGRSRLIHHSQRSGESTLSVSATYGTGGSGGATGKRLTMTYPSGAGLIYRYDRAGQLEAITLADGRAIISAIGYQPFGPVNRWTWGDPAATPAATYTRDFDLSGRISSYPLGTAFASGSRRVVTYDNADRITALTPQDTHSSAQQYVYDHLDRLNGATRAGSNRDLGYQYDSNGNRTQLTEGTNRYTHTIADDSNRLTSTSTSGPAPGNTHTYDAMGNLLTDGRNTYTYNSLGKLDSVSNGAGTVTYSYDGLGYRIEKKGPVNLIITGVNRYAYDPAGHLIGEYDGNDNMLQETVYLGDLPVAVLKESNQPDGTPKIDIHYLYADHTNTPRVITNATDHQIVWRWDNSDPFGLTGPDENPTGLGTFIYNPRFPGQVFDKESQLNYNVNRYYDAHTGSYTQSDPVGLAGGSLSTYSYVNGNPVSFVDPLGLWSFSANFYGAGLGGGVNLSYASGTLEGTLQFGAGFSAGASFDPRGAPSPQSQCQGAGFIARTNAQAGLGISAGLIGIGGQASATSGNGLVPIADDGYASFSGTYINSGNPSQIGLTVGASMNVELGGYINWKGMQRPNVSISPLK